MSSLSEQQRIDQELTSELVESPINPAFIHMSAPLKSEYDPLFYLQINREALWQWRKLISDHIKVFEVLQDNLALVGYKLLPSSALRVGTAITSRIAYLAKKSRSTTNGTAVNLCDLGTGVALPFIHMKSHKGLLKSSAN